jgi:hypothetical protein
VCLVQKYSLSVRNAVSNKIAQSANQINTMRMEDSAYYVNSLWMDANNVMTKIPALYVAVQTIIYRTIVALNAVISTQTASSVQDKTNAANAPLTSITLVM